MSQMHAFYSVAYVVDGRWFVDLLCLSFIVVWFFIWRCFCARNRHVHFMSFCFCILFCSFSPHSHSLCLPVSFFVYVYKYARVRTESNMRILFLPAIYGPYIRTLFMCTLYWLNAFPDSLILDHFMCSIFSSVNKKVSFWKVFVLIDLVFCGIFRLFFCFPWKSTFLFIVTTSLLYFLYIVMLSNLLENLYHQSTILK